VTYFSFAISELDQGFLAGFFEGEASFVVQEQNAGQSYSCGAIVRVRDDDQDVLEWLVALTGVGRMYRVPARATSKPQVAWHIDTQHDCVEIGRLLAHCGFHGRRAAELEIWMDAVRAWVTDGGDDRRTSMRALKAALDGARKYQAVHPRAVPFADRRTLTLGYISGLVSAEGSFYFSTGRPRFSVHLRQDDRPLLDLLAATTWLGRVYNQAASAPLNPSSVWTVGARPQLQALVELLREADLPGRKRTEMETWAMAVEELEGARCARRQPRPQVLELAADQLHAMRTYRPSTREVLELPRRDVREESLEALRAWAAETSGTLSCVAYSRWRRDRAHCPCRNSIVTAFGSWYGAMEAAGLADRAARRQRVRHTGAAARRAERHAEQRARVLDAVRRCQAELGRAPRAMEFFRWRFAGAPDSPTQATVYNLFPGGWAEVLKACRAGYGLG
jgi:hypothetical protein